MDCTRAVDNEVNTKRTIGSRILFGALKSIIDYDLVRAGRRHQAEIHHQREMADIRIGQAFNDIQWPDHVEHNEELAIEQIKVADKRLQRNLAAIEAI